VLYRHADALYTLVTDQVFLNEPSVVWERLEDVDQGASVFVDGAFQLATPVGGDWAGWTPGPERAEDPAEYVFPLDVVSTLMRIVGSRELALQLQNAEDELAQQARAKHEERLAQRRRDEREMAERHSHQPKRKDKNKKDNNCSIM
jgi:hypothetical protein